MFKTLNDKALAVVICSVGFGFLFDFLFFEQMPGINIFIFNILVLAGIFLFGKEKINKQSILLASWIVFFSAMTFVRASPSIIFLDIFATYLLLFVLAQNMLGLKISDFLIIDYLKIFLAPLLFIYPFFKTIGMVFKNNKEKSGSHTKLKRILKGLLLATPILILFLALFSSADMVFNKYITNFFDFGPDLFPRFSIITFFALLSCGFFSYLIQDTAKKFFLYGEEQKLVEKKSFGYIEGVTILTSVVALFFFFIILQIAYLFGGEGNITAQGFTYAEYARRGFGELVAVAIFSFILLYAKDKMIEKVREKTHGLLFKILSSVLVLEVLIIIASAFKRLWLYEEAFGFTVDRLYATTFVLFLAVISVLLLYKIFVDHREKVFAFASFMAIVATLAGLNILNPDAFIARVNIDRFENSKELDVDYLNTLSTDALEESLRIIDVGNKIHKENFVTKWFFYKKDSLDSEYFTNWRAFNLSRLNARKILDSKKDALKEYIKPEFIVN